MVTAFIDEHRGRFGVEPICRVLDVSASAYYRRATGRRSERAIDDERLLGRIRQLHAANHYAYGYRRTCKALLRAGEDGGRDRVKRLMRTHGIQGAKRRGKSRRTTIADPEATRRRHGADVELVHHSVAGSQYTSHAFGQDHQVLGSIGSVGDA